jgi:hypothetical protein
MQTAEIRITGGNLAERLGEMRAWLDAKRFEPSSFTYFRDGGALVVRVAFKVDSEAHAFALKFGESLSETGSAPQRSPIIG